MKRLCIVLLCCFAVWLSSSPAAFADGISEEMAKVVSDNLDNFFPISSIGEGYGINAAAVRGNIGPETATEAGTANGTRNLLLYTNPDGTTEYAYKEKLTAAGNLKNFYYAMDIMPNDLYPADGGGCMISYFNELIPGLCSDSEAEEVSLIVSDAVYLETRKADDAAGVRTKLADFAGGKVSLAIVRLTGETLFYADGSLIGSYHDGKYGPFQLYLGTKSFTDGEVVDCSFDNLTVRKVVP